MKTLFSALCASHEARPDHTAIVTPESSLTASAVLNSTIRLAAHLDECRVSRGERVGIALHNGADFVTSFFAIASRGAVVVPLNPALREGELATILSDADVSLILTEESLHSRCELALHAANGLSANRVHIVADLPTNRPLPTRTDHAQPDDPLLFLYSSGSTGTPKRVARTHENLLFETTRLIAALNIEPSDRILGVAPFSHVNGLLRSMIASRVAGATLVTMPQFERRAVAHAIEEHAVTGFIGVPFMFEVLAQSRWPAPVDFSSLRYCISASAPLRPESSMRFHERYGRYVLQLYGTTETGTISLNTDDVSATALESVGTSLPGVFVEIFNDVGEIVEDGSTGDIGIRSPAAASDYPGLPDQSRQSFRNGYFFPGDVGRRDADGRIYLTGRKSLFINRGGFKVNPYEVEAVLATHPKIKEASVCGVQTPLGDERVKAVVVLREPAEPEEIIAFCSGRIADYKIPSVVEFREELPKSATGKVLRSKL